MEITLVLKQRVGQASANPNGGHLNDGAGPADVADACSGFWQVADAPDHAPSPPGSHPDPTDSCDLHLPCGELASCGPHRLEICHEGLGTLLHADGSSDDWLHVHVRWLDPLLRVGSGCEG